MNGSVVVVNAGSSSVKLAAWPAATLPPHDAGGPSNGNGLRATPRRHVVEGASPDIAAELGRLLAGPGVAPVAAIGHRIVHGGTRASPALVDAALIAELEALTPLAPLHQPQGLAALRAAALAVPGVPQVACFDTAFHRGQPDVAQAYALPAALRERGLHRYGFHGLSCEHAIATLRAAAPAIAAGRVVVAHLGSGASLTAIRGGRSVATTMGYTALDGLPMATRCGALDPGVLLELVRAGFDAAALERLLYRESGLLGLSGTSGDVRVLLAREPADERARFALEFFVYRCVREAGSLAAALGGLDALLFTGGIGEHQPAIRERIAAGLGWLGLQLDAGANARGAPVISASGSAVECRVVVADEERVIAAATAALALSPGSCGVSAAS